MVKVLITGSNGLIGSALKQMLRAKGITYDVVERTSNSPHPVEKIEPILNGPTVYRVNWPEGLSKLPYSEYSTVIHLAVARSDPKASLDTSIKDHLIPVQAILEGIQNERPSCSLLFISSQSASPDAVSGYGRGKWACEQLIRNSPIAWTIMRPGLIVSSSPKGLCGAIMALMRRSPIVPVPAGDLMQVQPVLLSDIITACLKIISQPTLHTGACYDLALPPRELPFFVRELCQNLHLKRLVLPIPWRIISGLLRLCEHLPIKLPVSRANLEGLLASRSMNSDESAAALQITLQSCSEAEFISASDSPDSREAHYLFNAMFRSEAPPEVVTRYLEAQKALTLNGTWIDIDTILQKKLDVEAIEFASRRRKTILSQKMHMMCFVAEQSPSLLPHFINKRTIRLHAFVELGVAGIRSAWKLLYGVYLVRRHHLLSTEPCD